MSKREVINKLKKYLLKLNNAGIPIQKAFLYGSYVNGTANEESDIDVMLVSEVFGNNDINIKVKAWLFTQDIDSRIEPYTVGLQRFIDDDVSPLLEIVRREGLEIMC